MTHVERLLALEQFGIKLGLEAMRLVLSGLADPQSRFPSVHVAGTNGKGSVTAMLDTALRGAGWRVGRYTSPHLAHLEERVVVDGRSVSANAFETALGRVFAVIDDLVARGILAAVPTFFEVSTAAAFVVFADAQVDVAVIEVGLGGRYDATNVITPVVSAITSIDFDHERYLGTTLAAIAGEKAGIAKPGVPLVVGPVVDEAFAVIAEAAARVGAPLITTGPMLAAPPIIDGGHAVLQMTTTTRSYPPVRLGLAGAHQAGNALVAVGVLEILERLGLGPLDGAAITRGLRDVRWPARLEWLRHGGQRRILIDAAHNPAGARALASYLEAAAVPAVTLVTSIMADKDVAGVLGPLLPHVRRVLVTRAETPRASDTGALAARIQALAPALPVRIVDAPTDAVWQALTDPEPVLLAGSIFLVGPLRDALLRDESIEPA